MQLISWWTVVLLSLSLIKAEDLQQIEDEWSSKCVLDWKLVCSDLHFPDLNKPALFYFDPEKNNNISLPFLIFVKSEFAHFPLGLFQNQQWEKISLEKSKIKKIDEKNFEGATFLNELDLSGNSLEEIPKSIFSGAGNLEILTLANNKISKLYLESFQGLQKLSHLHLGSNNLEELPLNLFEELPSLSHLQLFNNQLVNLDAKLFVSNKAIKTINFSGNHLANIPPNIFFDLENLYKIDLSENGNLETLELQVNTSQLRANDCNLKSLKIFGSVQWLDVRNNLLKSDSVYFENPSALKDLFFANNSVEDLGFLKPMSNLEMLDLSHHPNLDLDSMDFACRFLAYLHLKNCQLKTLPVKLLERCSLLRTLDISKNHLTEIDRKNFKYFTHLYFMDIRRNPWKCKNLENLFKKSIIPNKIHYHRDEIDKKFKVEQREGIACLRKM